MLTNIMVRIAATLLALCGLVCASSGVAPAVGAAQEGTTAVGPSRNQQSDVAVGGVAAAKAPVVRLAPSALKIMNYYPARTPWKSMWRSYKHAQIDADMGAIAGLGANTVRIIVQPSAVGWPTVDSAGAAEFADVIRTAHAHGLAVMVTLFDQWSQYGGNINLSKVWVSSLLAKYVHNPEITLVEIRNELPTNQPRATAWAQAMLLYLHRIAPSIPRTVSFAGNVTPNALSYALSQFGPMYVDVLDAHLYGTYQAMRANLQKVVSLAEGRPVIVGEGGIATANNSMGDQSAQAAFYRQLERLCLSFGISTFAPWILSDIDGGPRQRQNYGLRTLSGSWKLAADVVRAMFEPDTNGVAAASTTTTTSSNLLTDPDFRSANTTPDQHGSIGAWNLITATNVAHAGVVSTDLGPAAYLSGAYGTADNSWPAFAQWIVLDDEHALTLHANVRVGTATGHSAVGLWFIDARQRLIGFREAWATNSASNWQSLSVSTAVPNGAVWVVVRLRSTNNAGSAEFTNVNLQAG